MKRVDIRGLAAMAMERAGGLRARLARTAAGAGTAAPRRLALPPGLAARLPKLRGGGLSTPGAGRIARAGALALVTLGIAVSAGDFVQSRAAPEVHVAALTPAPAPRAIEPLAAPAEAAVGLAPAPWPRACPT
jgi:hypothetical protein